MKTYQEAVERLIRELGQETDGGGLMIPREDTAALRRFAEETNDALDTTM